MSEHDDDQQPAEPIDRSVLVPRGRRFWLAPLPRRPEPSEDETTEEPDAE